MTELNPKEDTTVNMENRTANTDAQIAEGMDDLRKGIEAQLEEQQQRRQPVLSELERFMASVEKQRDMVRQRTLDRESRFQLDRAAIVNEFWLRFQQLQHELEDTLRTMDLAHEKQVDSDHKLFSALDAARG